MTAGSQSSPSLSDPITAPLFELTPMSRTASVLSSPKRTRFQFKLRSLLIAMVVVGLIGAYVARESVRHRQAQSVAREIAALGGSVSWNQEVFENILHDRALTRITDVHFTNPSFPSHRWLALQRLPQSFGLQVRGAEFDDESLPYLKQIPQLKYVVLKNTTVTDQALAELKKARPELTIMIGYPEDPDFREIR